MATSRKTKSPLTNVADDYPKKGRDVLLFDIKARAYVVGQFLGDDEKEKEHGWLTPRSWLPLEQVSHWQELPNKPAA